MKQVVLAALFVVSSPVFAQGYVGVGLGQSSADVEAVDFGPGVTASIDDTDTAFKIFAGYAINPNFALEAGYTDLGEVGVDYTDGINWVKERYEVNAFYVSAIGSVPVGQANLFAKFGFARWDLDGSASASTGASASASWSGTDPLLGIGVSFNATDVLMLRAEFERFMDIGDENESGQSDVDVIGVSAAVKF